MAPSPNCEVDAKESSCHAPRVFGESLSMCVAWRCSDETQIRSYWPKLASSGICFPQTSNYSFQNWIDYVAIQRRFTNGNSAHDVSLTRMAPIHTASFYMQSYLNGFKLFFVQ